MTHPYTTKKTRCCLKTVLFDYITHNYYYYWSLLYNAILRSPADSLHSHVILHEWIAFYCAFLNIHRSGECVDILVNEYDYECSQRRAPFHVYVYFTWHVTIKIYWLIDWDAHIFLTALRKTHTHTHYGSKTTTSTHNMWRNCNKVAGMRRQN